MDNKLDAAVIAPMLRERWVCSTVTDNGYKREDSVKDIGALFD